MNTQKAIDDLVLDFYYELLGRIFTGPLLEGVEDRRRRKTVERQIDEVAEAASKSLTLFLVNTGLNPQEAQAVLEGLGGLPSVVTLEAVAVPNVNPESLAESTLGDVPPPGTVSAGGRDAEYRVALHIVLQVLTLMGPVMQEWRKTNLSASFELPRTVVARMNRISAKLGASGEYGQQAADENYELIYRDYLSQRFHRVEAGTVRMTTNMWVGLDELFVMPNVAKRPAAVGEAGEPEDRALMDLAAARRHFGDTGSDKEEEEKPTALEQVLESPRTVIVGAPGAGKSTFLEWLQLKVTTVDQEFVLGGQQAIPLLLRLRELDPQHLPRGLGLIEKATASADRASLMPPEWIERQMEAGRVLFMVDGLDETDPEQRDRFVIPWLEGLLAEYPDCRYVVSSRPTGYPAGTLIKQKFVECDLLDFNTDQISKYARHWCTAVRLAQNEPEEQARSEGEREGKEIVGQFEKQAYIRNLARNPLMLSAICLVNYFEHGKLPDDRARLYRLCVEGLVHNWDQRRGIHSEFSLDEKLQVCREVAIEMQSADRAEIERERLRDIFGDVLGDPDRAHKLLEHIRHRSGLLIERRADVFAFAHLTFQEYLAACAVHESNRCGVTIEQLVHEHGDSRWQEVIALFCGNIPLSAKRDLLERLMDQDDTKPLGAVLAQAYLASGAELARDQDFRVAVLERIAVAPQGYPYALSHFPDEEVAPIANRQLGRGRSENRLSEAFRWLADHTSSLDAHPQARKLAQYQSVTTAQLTELVYVVHLCADSQTLQAITSISEIYTTSGCSFSAREAYPSQAVLARRPV